VIRVKSLGDYFDEISEDLDEILESIEKAIDLIEEGRSKRALSILAEARDALEELLGYEEIEEEEYEEEDEEDEDEEEE
jgi:dsDNA-binding SOS-regulon protein